jgi:glycerol-3-phosphate acyltransferase PlsX
MRIAIDAMGGDHAPDDIVQGAVEAASQLSDATLILVGQRDRIEPQLRGARNVTVQHASEVVGMHEDPGRALRSKPDSSIRVGLSHVKAGKADAIISAGNTGALVGGATVPLLGLGVLEGVKRPGIAVPFPTEKGFCALLDAGANKNSKAVHLLQYAVMGSVYIRQLRKEITDPKIALLNIGEERNKGTDVHKEAHALLEKSFPNFIGNIEPHKVYSGAADVVVSDGFTGNIFLKTAEGMSSFLMGMIRSNGLSHSEDIKKGVERVEARTDYSAYGGAPVLGCRGIVMKCHGRSRARAITNAVLVTADLIRHRMNEGIVAEIQKHQARRGWFGWFAGAKDGDVEE